MARNTIGGKGHKRAKKISTEKRQMPFKNIDEGTDYAVVQKLLGSGWIQLVCVTDNKTRLGKIRGSMYKKVWIGTNDVLLVSYRDFQDDKCDVIFKYNSDEISQLVSRGYITQAQLQCENVNNNNHEYDDGIVFGENLDIDIDEI